MSLSMQIWINGFTDWQKFTILQNQRQRNIIKSDKNAPTHHNYYTSKKWNNSASYNLCLDSGILGVEGCVEMIKAAIELKKKMKAW